MTSSGRHFNTLTNKLGDQLIKSGYVVKTILPEIDGGQSILRVELGKDASGAAMYAFLQMHLPEASGEFESNVPEKKMILLGIDIPLSFQIPLATLDEVTRVTRTIELNAVVNWVNCHADIPGFIIAPNSDTVQLRHVVLRQSGHFNIEELEALLYGLHVNASLYGEQIKVIALGEKTVMELFGPEMSGGR